MEHKPFRMFHQSTHQQRRLPTGSLCDLLRCAFNCLFSTHRVVGSSESGYFVPFHQEKKHITILDDFLDHLMEIGVRPPAPQSKEALPKSDGHFSACRKKIANQLLGCVGGLLMLFQLTVCLNGTWQIQRPLITTIFCIYTAPSVCKVLHMYHPSSNPGRQVSLTIPMLQMGS